MQSMNPFEDDGACLKWKAPGPAHGVDFLNLHIQFILDGSITTSTCEKLMNLYQFQK
jgi:hypothetical protein